MKSSLKVLQQLMLSDAEAEGVSTHAQPSSGSASGSAVSSGRGARSAKKDADSFASKAEDLRHTGMKERSKRKPVVGSSTTNNRVKSVDTVRTVDIFISRLHPSTSSSELAECVETVKGSLCVTAIKCNKLQSKYEHLYSSFHVAVTVSTMHFKSAIDLFSSAEAWPTGVFVKRYFHPRNGSTED